MNKDMLKIDSAEWSESNSDTAMSRKFREGKQEDKKQDLEKCQPGTQK